jgi:hypothetical protein
MNNSHRFSLGTIDLWEFLRSEKYRLIGERSRKVIQDDLWNVYNKSELNGDAKIKLVNNKKNFLLILPKNVFANREKLIPKNVQSILIPRFVEVYPTVIMFSSWFIGDAGMSPERDPAFFGDNHTMLLKVMTTFEEMFDYPKREFFIVVQYPFKHFIKMSEEDKINEVQRHANLLSNVISTEKIALVHSGKRGKQGKIPTLSVYYNPALFELVVSLAETLTLKMPIYIERNIQPEWLKTPIDVFKKRLATVDLKKVCEKLGYKTVTVSNDKVTAWRNKRYPFTFNPFLQIDYETLLWVGAMQAEGTKEKQMEFVASNKELLEIIFRQLKKIFDLSTIDPHYDILIGENLHNEVHANLGIPLEEKFNVYVELETKGQEKVTQCESQEVKDFFIKKAKELLPVIDEMRFYRLRVDRVGKKSHLRIEINCSGRIAKPVWFLVNEMFYDFYNFINEFKVHD